MFDISQMLHMQFISKTTTSMFSLCRLVNSELTLFKGAINSLDGLDNFGNSLFDIWTVNR